ILPGTAGAHLTCEKGSSRREAYASCPATARRSASGSILPIRGLGNAPAGPFYLLLLLGLFVAFELHEHAQLILLGQLAVRECRGATADPLFLLPALEAGQHVTQSGLDFARGLAATTLVQLDKQIFNPWVVILQ